MKKFAITTFAIVAAFTLSACQIDAPKPKADIAQARATEEAAQEANRSVGMPAITHCWLW